MVQTPIQQILKYIRFSLQQEKISAGQCEVFQIVLNINAGIRQLINKNCQVKTRLILFQ